MSIKEKFNNLDKREKLIIIAAFSITLFFLWDNFFYQPTYKKQLALQVKLNNAEQQKTDQQLSIINFENSSHTDPNLINTNKLISLKTQYNKLQELMIENNSNFVPPHLMGDALNDILNKNKQLTLVKLNTLPITTLLESQKNNPIYKHGLIMTFTGNYQDTFEYLKTLESLPWKLIWESIDFQVKDHPVAETTIKVYTLSFKENWIGV